jgi:hypothetical protein
MKSGGELEEKSFGAHARTTVVSCGCESRYVSARTGDIRGKVKIPPEHSLGRRVNKETKMENGKTHALATMEKQAKEFQKAEEVRER